jgi:alpha-tubulin suppressor-like RCC1 family protein
MGAKRLFLGVVAGGALVAACASLDGLAGTPDPPAPGPGDSGLDGSEAAAEGGPACGAIGQPCCGTSCGARAACASGSCVACGGLDQPCCTNDACSAEFACRAGSCKKGCAVKVAAGDTHTCAVRSDGALFCWGDNGSGQLGLGASDGKPVPTPKPVSQLTNVVDVGGGDVNTCAVTKDKSLYCWGNNFSGSLGLGAVDGNPHPAPVAVPQMSDSVEVVLAYVHTCARKGDLSVWCWGNNGAGQVGNGTSGSPVPSPYKTTAVATAIAAGNAHTCAVLNTGAISCWGYNAYGQIGTGSTGAPLTTPTPIAGGRAYTRVAAGQDHTCAIATNGDLYCWGENDSGQLGTGDKTTTPTPFHPAGVTAKKVAAAGSTTCFIAADDSLQCMGYNGYGAFGNATKDDAKTPQKAAIPVPVTEIALGLGHACAIDASGFVWCMGKNTNGQLGLGGTDTNAHTTPERVPLACP